MTNRFKTPCCKSDPMFGDARTFTYEETYFNDYAYRTGAFKRTVFKEKWAICECGKICKPELKGV